LDPYFAYADVGARGQASHRVAVGAPVRGRGFMVVFIDGGGSTMRISLREAKGMAALCCGLAVGASCGVEEAPHEEEDVALHEQAVSDERASAARAEKVRSRKIAIPPAIPLPLMDGEPDVQFQRMEPEPLTRVVRGAQPGPADLTARFRALYDGMFLYLIVEVDDDQVVVDSASDIPWEDDAVELFIDGDGSFGNSYDGVHDLHLVMRPGDRSVYLGHSSARIAAGAVAFVGKQHATGYQMEIVIPWSVLQVERPVGGIIGVDVQVDDDDDGGERDHKIAWSAWDDEAWQHPNRFGRVRLAPKAEQAYLVGLGDLPGGGVAS
jgi:hypothetical protein